MHMSVLGYRQRVACLAGLPVSAMATVKAGLELNEGALELCQCLRGLGCRLAVVSGGFMPLILHVQERLGIDHAFGNEVRLRRTERHEAPCVTKVCGCVDLLVPLRTYSWK